MKHHDTCTDPDYGIVIDLGDGECVDQCCSCGAVGPFRKINQGDIENCRGLGLEHRWVPGDLTGALYCSKCGVCKDDKPVREYVMRLLRGD